MTRTRVRHEIGEKIGGFVVVDHAVRDPQYGETIVVECSRCRRTFQKLAAQLRHNAKMRKSAGKPGPFCFECSHLPRVLA